MPLFIIGGITAAATIGSAVIGANAAGKAADATAASSAAAIAENRRQFDIAQTNQRPWLVTGTSALNKLAGIYGLDTYQPNWDSSGNLVQSPVAGTGGVTAAPGGGGSTPPPVMGGSGAVLFTSLGRRLAAQLPTQTGTTPQASPGTYTPGSQQPGIDPYADFYQSPDYQFRLAQGMRGLQAQEAAAGTLGAGGSYKAAQEYAGNLASGEYNNYANRLAALAGVGQTTATNLAGQGQNYANTVGNIAINQGNNRASSYLAQGQSYGNAIGSLAGIGSGLIQNNPQWFNGGGGYATYNPTSGWNPGPQGFPG